MTTDRLFVIMLVILIPMTGCFGALDNADAQDETVQNTSETIVNNYYYNNTTTVVAEEVEYFTVGGMFDKDNLTTDAFGYYYLFNFSTTAGQLVEMHYLNREGAVYLQVETSCADGSSDNFYDAENMVEGYLYGSHTSCEHAIRLGGVQDSFGFSMVYSIRSATVV